MNKTDELNSGVFQFIQDKFISGKKDKEYILKISSNDTLTKYPFDFQIKFAMDIKDSSNNFKKEAIIYNKYTRHDATLPRINTIKCINSKCVSNKDYTNVLLLNDISVHRDRPEFDKKFEEIVVKLGIDRENIIQLDEDTIIIKSVSNLVETRSELEKLHHFIEYHEKLDSQIIFIKYDPDELRYVYICDYCNTSWKK